MAAGSRLALAVTMLATPALVSVIVLTNGVFEPDRITQGTHYAALIASSVQEKRCPIAALTHNATYEPEADDHQMPRRVSY